MQRFADALAEVRSAPLPFVLLSFNYGAYLLAGLIASCSLAGLIALALIERYAADRERVALFLDAERTTETLMLSQKTHIFPLSNPKQDDLLPSAHARALQYDHGMQEGDYLFITRDTPSLTHIQHAVLSELRDQMRGLHVDSTEYVYAIRLSASHPKGQP